MQLRNRGQWETGAQGLCLVWDTWGGGGGGGGGKCRPEEEWDDW